jgi:hypothetical protein
MAKAYRGPRARLDAIEILHGRRDIVVEDF